MLKVDDFRKDADFTEEEVVEEISKERLILEIKTSSKFRFMPYKNKVIEQIQSMSDEQVQQFVKEAYPMAKKRKGTLNQ